jgi:predicted KAP-like P-loop ATPase
LANALEGMSRPYGTVVGLQGSWGSGKSGVVNLVRARLQDPSNDIDIVSFNPWWFSKVDDLTPVFFSEVAAALPASGTEAIKSKLRGLGAKLGRHAGLFGGALDAVSAGATGGLGGSGMAALAELINPDRSVTEEHAALAEALSTQKRRILVVIDDLDRLDAGQILEMLKLVKSAGQLPNVMYLLVYDRAIVDHVLTELAPGEAPQYLEKIVQATFSLPPALAEDLREWLFAALGKIIGVAEAGPEKHFYNLLQSVVLPTIKSPRDAVRLANVLSATWPAVSEVANAADFVAIETLRLFYPSVHEAIQRNRALVLGEKQGIEADKTSAEELDELLLDGVNRDRLKDLRYGLALLFPKLAGPWENYYFGDDPSDAWRRDRRICSETYFYIYFRLSGGEQGAVLQKVERLLGAMDDKAEMVALLRTSASTSRPKGGTMAAVLLEELKARAPDIDKSKTPALVQALFEAADDLMVPEDERWELIRENNERRLHWLINRLVWQRFEENERDKIFSSALQTASLQWAADFVTRCVKQHDEHKERSDSPLVSRDCAFDMQQRMMERLQAAASDDSLLRLRDLTAALAQWLYLCKGACDEQVKAWITGHLEDVSTLARLAECFIGQVRTESDGDRVAVIRDFVRLEKLDWLVNPEDFLRRVNTASADLPADDESRNKLERFIQAVAVGKNMD